MIKFLFCQKVKRTKLLLLSIVLFNSAICQVDTVQYRNTCLIVKKNNSGSKDALEIRADKFLQKDQVYLYFHLKQSDTLTILLNDSLVKKQYVSAPSERTGDYPDYFIKIDTRTNKDSLAVHFANEKSFFKIRMDKRYRVFGIVYKTGVWQECIYVEKKKYFRFS
jgi:hypothetical protein